VKLLILSDTHGDTGAVPGAVKRENPDVIIHLGDYTSDFKAIRELFPELPFYGVRGNNDYHAAFNDEELIELGGKKIFMTHGHGYHVKSGLSDLIRKGVSLGADLTLFGHTHKACITQSGSLTLFNPGAAAGWGHEAELTYGTVRLSGGGIRCKVREAAQRR
jgi:hypothetical protein